MEILEKAYAKINISLDILGEMDNGYHEMLMVMQSISLGDDVKIRAEKGAGKIYIKSNIGYIPSDRRNIAYKAAEAFFGLSGISGYDTYIDIFKRTPVCAGLGGGSSDGAAVLRGLNKMFSAGFSLKELEKLAEKLGSDVPFCVRGGTVLAEGTGTSLSDLPPLPECAVLVCKPSFSISTPELFSKIDCKKIKCRPDTNGIIDSLGRGDIRGVGMRLYNVFEDVLEREKDKIEEIKSTMYDCSALGACMTGTGSAVFGIFDGRETAEQAEKLLAGENMCHIAFPVGKILAD